MIKWREWSWMSCRYLPTGSPERIVQRVEFRKIRPRSQFHQEKTMEAEQNIRDAIEIVEKQKGKDHSWVPEFKTVLEGWLREDFKV